MTPPARCPKCEGRMSAGFILDQGYGSTIAGRWQDGEPKKYWLGGIKEAKEDQHQITSYRCDRCGYLESYAR